MTELRAVAFVSGGIWVADCPRPWCVHADHYGPGPMTGRIGGLTEKTFTCLYCGLVCEAVWPPNAEDIVRLLKQRPQPETRNWLPGEHIDELLMENIAHGLMDPTALPAGLIAFDGYLANGVRSLAPADSLAIGA